MMWVGNKLWLGLGKEKKHKSLKGWGSSEAYNENKENTSTDRGTEISINTLFALSSDYH